ncbi:MAG: amidohydrolase family protein [Planctomycetaceae bacterium]|nr:amidohydrolase family protein [Planctomycetaceae bacterium]
MENSFALRGDICYSESLTTLSIHPNSYLVCVDGVSAGVHDSLPDEYKHLPVINYEGHLITPGLVDLHMHAPQFAFRGLGMDLELLEWLNTRTFPEEAKYADVTYARAAYTRLIDDLKNGPNTRLGVFATLHLPATLMLMEMLEESGLVSMVGKVNMDRNSPDNLCEASAQQSLADTRRWLGETADRFANTTPILTPRFIPSCSDELLRGIVELQKECNLPVQSHLSENQSEVDWVAELCPGTSCYGDAYRNFGLFGGEVPTIMAHCVWSGEKETALMAEGGVFVAHCPQSNMNLSSGIAPVRRFLNAGVRVGLGSDMAGGCHNSIFRAMSDAVQASKLRWRLVDSADKPLTVEEVFYLATIGGGSFFGKVGSFEPGYELDALVIDDRPLLPPFEAGIAERLARVTYLSDDRHIVRKFARGRQVK